MGPALFYRMPFPDQNNLLQLIWLEKPYLFYGIKWAYLTMLFSTPYIGFSLLFSLGYIFVVRHEARDRVRQAASVPGGGRPRQVVS